MLVCCFVRSNADVFDIKWFDENEVDELIRESLEVEEKSRKGRIELTSTLFASHP
jgi:hypothetical protein